MATSKPSLSRGQRADARHNRAVILDAGATLFAERGVDVQMGDVARAAGLAIGTVYRHFATKEALVDALLADRLDRAAAASRAAAAAEGDPWQALTAFLRAITASQIADRGLSQYIGGRIVGSQQLRRQRDELFTEFERLVEAAREAGHLRRDIEATDIRAAMICIARASAADWPEPDWLLDRYLPIVLDGLHAPGHTTLTGHPPAASELRAATTGHDPGVFTRGRRRWRAT